MITQEFITIGTRRLVQTKSDTYKIQKVGTDEIYGSATDVLNSGFEYIETDVPLDEKQKTNTERLINLGIVNNPTTSGLSDSTQAMTYKNQKEK